MSAEDGVLSARAINEAVAAANPRKPTTIPPTIKDLIEQHGLRPGPDGGEGVQLRPPTEHVVRPSNEGGKVDKPQAEESELTTDELVDDLRKQVNELAWYLAQTRFACDCLFQGMTSGLAPGIPWEDMGVQVPVDEQPVRPPSRATRRQAGRNIAKRMTTSDGE